MRYLTSLADTVRQSLELRRLHGVPLLTQARDMIAIKRQGTGLGLQDYFDHRLFERGPDADARRRTIAGWRWQTALDVQLNHRRWKCLVDDKLVAYVLLGSAGIPFPRLAAVYNRQGRAVSGIPCFSSPSALAEFLRRDARFPLFAKPVRGSVGGGGAALTGYDATRDVLTVGNGQSVAVEAFVADLEQSGRGKIAHAGYLFQAFVDQHPAIAEVAGPTVSTARIVVLVGDDEAVAHTAIWRIGVKGNMTDNFDKGRSGNLIAGLDLADGHVRRVVKGYGMRQAQVDRHPDTGRPLAGFRLPDWHRALDYCRTGAPSFPNLRFQHWDVAFARTGPVVLEVNTLGSIDMVQYATGTGLFDNRLRAFVQRYG